MFDATTPSGKIVATALLLVSFSCSSDTESEHTTRREHVQVSLTRSYVTMRLQPCGHVALLRLRPSELDPTDTEAMLSELFSASAETKVISDEMRFMITQPVQKRWQLQVSVRCYYARIHSFLCVVHIR